VLLLDGLEGQDLQQSFTVIVNDMAPLANMSDLMKALFVTLEDLFCQLELKTSSKKMKWLHLGEGRVHTVLTCSLRELQRSLVHVVISTSASVTQHQWFSKDELKQSCSSVTNAQ